MQKTGTRVATLSVVLLALPVLVAGGGCGCGDDLVPTPFGVRDLVECPPIDIVFLMDTSGSMEDEAAALCAAIRNVETELLRRGAEVANVTLLGITETAEDTSDPVAFGCITAHVAETYGTAVPGSPPPAIAVLEDDEDWGPATAVVAANHPWVPGALRLIVPISDEGPYDGDPCDDPGDDRDIITHAIDVATTNNVIVSPIAGTGSDACVVNLGIVLAQGTGGTAFRSIDPANEIAGFVVQLIENACRGTGRATCPNEQLRVFDDDNDLDDVFDVFLDGQLLFRTPAPGGSSAPCINDLPSGRHTLRIVFVSDEDDPGGQNPSDSGNYGIVLVNGVTFVDGPGVTGPVTADGELFPPGTFDEYVIDVP